MIGVLPVTSSLQKNDFRRQETVLCLKAILQAVGESAEFCCKYLSKNQISKTFYLLTYPSNCSSINAETLFKPPQKDVDRLQSLLGRLKEEFSQSMQQEIFEAVNIASKFSSQWINNLLILLQRVMLPSKACILL